MIRINRETDYSFRVILALSKAGENARLSTADIQKNMQIPISFLHRIIASLARNNIVKTFPGREGGVQLARSPKNITLLDIYEAVEGPIQLSACLVHDSDCPLNPACPVHNCLDQVQKAIIRELKSVHFDGFQKESPAILP
ncbi:MAG: Rrf2 family transcriptional regulator [Leptolinea sp.]